MCRSFRLSKDDFFDIILLMLFAAHVIPAGYVGEMIGNPFLAFLAGIVIHFILDCIPHYDTTDGGKYTLRQWALVLMDLAVGLYIILFILRPEFNINSPFLWGAFGGILPDLFEITPFINKVYRRNKIGATVHKFHNGIQKIHIKSIPGLLVQVFVIILFSYLYLHMGR